MQHLQTSFFYDLQELIRNAPLLRKYYYIFKALNLSALPDRNYGPGRTGHSKPVGDAHEKSELLFAQHSLSLFCEICFLP